MGRLRLSRGKSLSAKKLDKEQEPTVGQTTDAGARIAPFIESTSDAPPIVEESLPARRDFDRLGDHVSSILSTAEEAAARIQEEARQEAERLREQAQNDAAACVEAARQGADSIMADAERLRADAEESTTEARQAADTYAADRRAEAEAQAREVLATAEREAATSSQDAERRQHALKTDVSLAEDRLRQLATGLHELAARLDKLLATPMGDDDGRGFSAGDEDSLLVAMSPTRETQEVTTE
jgi:uncharacterized phage infection (PIP) family protein YhgE